MDQVNVVFLHGLESSVDSDGVPVGRKARYLSATFGAALPALDTRIAQAIAKEQVARTGHWSYPFDGYEPAFDLPLQRARAAITRWCRYYARPTPM